MSRGINGEAIFIDNQLKKRFLETLQDAAVRFKIRLFAFCILDNHYHLALENSSGCLSAFMKDLNGRFGAYYRFSQKNRGYVFQNRFHSTLIENESYLLTAIRYILENPVRAGLTQHIDDYYWSSALLYFKGSSTNWIDLKFVETLFGTKRQLLALGEMPIKHFQRTKWGEIIGSEGFLEQAISRFDRRGEAYSILRKREDDRYFEPVEKVIQEFEARHKLKIDEINSQTLAGKRQRRELLVLLKDLTGLTYVKIAELDLFSDIQAASLRMIYRSFFTKKEKNR